MSEEAKLATSEAANDAENQSTEPAAADTPPTAPANKPPHSEPVEAPLVDEASATESPPAAPATSSAPDAATPADEATKPKIKIGSQRDQKPAAKARPQRIEKGADVAEVKPQEQKREKTAVPNVRQKLTDEMQQEFEMALGSGELDSMMSADTKDVVKQLEEGSEQTGTILAMREDSVFVDLGGRDQGVLSAKQFKEPPQVGAEINIRVNGFNAEDGLYEVSIPGAALDHADWADLAEGSIIDVMVTGHNKGGLEVEANKIRGFIPVSQVSLYRVDDLEQFLGQKMTCVATEVKPEKRNLVLSRRAILEREREEQREQLLQELEVGQTREGVVRKLEKFGAFVDIGGIDGLVHISQLSWDHVRHPSDVLEVGQQIKVRIEKIDATSGKIGLGYRDLFESPWVKAVEKYPTGSTAKGTVSKVADFGAFIKLEPGIEGLVHVSEIAHHRVNRVADYLAPDQEVDVKVLSVDPDKQRMSLSMKALAAQPPSAKGSKEEEYPEIESPKIKNRHEGALKGGTNNDAGGAQFGLKW